MATVVRFDCFAVDLASGQLRKNGIHIPLREQAFQVLAALLERPGEVVTREALRQRLWPDVVVDFENDLNSAVTRLRQALGDPAERPRFVETLRKRGYRFLAPVSHDARALAPAHTARPRVVVLPFVNLTGDPAQEYFSDGVTEEVIAELATLAPQLGVIARTTAMRYKGAVKDIAQIGRELDVAYVVEGSVSRRADQATIIVQVIRVSDQTHLFARRHYDGDPHNLFDSRSTVAGDIAAAIARDRGPAGAVSGQPRRGRRRPTEDDTAYKEYIQGRYLLDRGEPKALFQAKQLFESAIARDASFALAHDALADFYLIIGYLGAVRPKDAFSVGISHALAAVELDDTLAEAHALLAEYHKHLDYNWPAAERQMARALELDPSSPTVRFRRGVAILMPRGRIDEAICELEKAREIDPLSPLLHAWIGILRLFRRDYDGAIAQAEGMLRAEPASPYPHFILGCAYRQKYVDAAAGCSMRPDWADRAICSAQRSVELSAGANVFVGWLGLALAVCGREAEARGVLAQLKRSERYVLPSSVGFVHLGLGDIDAAFECFDRAVEERDQIMMAILSYPPFDPLRTDPRFAALLRKMKLA